MALFLLPLLSFLLLSATASHAALPAQEDYWHTLLPNTPMPDDIRDLILPADESVRAARTSGTTTWRNIIHYLWNKASTDAQIHNKELTSIFILEKDLVPGAKITPVFAKSTPSFAPFLPRHLADSIPFSSEKLPQILDRFSIKPGSSQAETMKETLRDCEEPVENGHERAKYGERKLCATSLESMVDFSTSVLGTREVRPISTRVVMGKKDNIGEYTVAAPNGVRRMSGSKFVVCHPTGWPFKVYLCHSWTGLRGYMVNLVGSDGAAMEAAAVCHSDTALWNPGIVGLKVLGVKPGTHSVCHFLPRGQIVWAATN